MTLAYPLLAKPIRFSEGKLPVLVIENPGELRRVIQTLQQQIEGAKGEFVFAENGELLNFSQNVALITDPFALSFDSRKLQSKIDQEAGKISAEYESQFRQVLLQLNELAAGICMQLDFEATFSLADSWDELIRIMKFHMDVEAISFSERILEYIKLQRKFFSKKLTVIYNLKAVLSEEELRSFYKMLRYEKLNLLLIEDRTRNRQPEYEEMIIVDKDLCIL